MQRLAAFSFDDLRRQDAVEGEYVEIPASYTEGVRVTRDNKCFRFYMSNDEKRQNWHRMLKNDENLAFENVMATIREKLEEGWRP